MHVSFGLRAFIFAIKPFQTNNPRDTTAAGVILFNLFTKEHRNNDTKNH